MKQPNILVYGSLSCPDTIRVRKFLDANGIAYESKDVDDSPEYSAYIADLNGGKRVLPTLRIDNQTVVNPSDDELREHLARAASQE